MKIRIAIEKFILIEMEDCADTFCTAERIRRVIRGVPTVTNEKNKKRLRRFRSPILGVRQCNLRWKIFKGEKSPRI